MFNKFNAIIFRLSNSNNMFKLFSVVLIFFICDTDLFTVVTKAVVAVSVPRPIHTFLPGSLFPDAIQIMFAFNRCYDATRDPWVINGCALATFWFV